MRKVIGDARLTYKCCKLYYEEDLSQQEIADKLGISRVTVSRMLSAGRESGIVKIQVISPNNLTYNALEGELEQKYNLKEAIVVENSPLSTSFDHATAIGTETLRLLESYLHDGDVVGVSMGETLRTVCGAPRENTDSLSCTFVPLVGGMHVGGSYEEIHANRIVRRFAEKFGGDYVELFAPAVFSSKEVLVGFRNEMPMKTVLKYYKKIKTIVVGIGYTPRVGATMQKAGYMTKKDLNKWIEKGAVGDVSLQMFNIDGDPTPFKDHNERVAGMPLKDLKNVENRIGIASGSTKADALYGAMKGGYINILVTDQECAEALLNR